ncbi:MAG: antibiotic biosynthesis monooxygenase [Massilia sp.]
MTVLLNILTVAPADRDRVLDMLRENIETVIRTLDGWVSTELVASADGSRIVIHSTWRDPAAVAAMRADPRMVAYFPQLAALASFDSIAGELAHTASA